MEISDAKILRMELKYCERCGGLWVRPLVSGEVYCSQCVAQVLDLPIGRPKLKARSFTNGFEIKGQYEEWAELCDERITL